MKTTANLPAVFAGLKKYAYQIIGITTLLLTLSLSTTAQNYFNDQSYKDPQFVAFKVKLVQAILQKDVDMLMPLVADVVHLDDNECSYASSDCLKERFSNPQAAQAYWKELYSVVSHGFARYKLARNDTYWQAGKGDIIFQAPAYMKHLSDTEMKTHLLVLGEYVNIREKPTIYSKVVGRSSYEKLPFSQPVPTVGSSDGILWYEVTLHNGKTGFVREDLVSASIVKELSIKKVNGQYKIISFHHPLEGELSCDGD